MNPFRSWAARLAAALLLAACGGGDLPSLPSGAPDTPGNFTSVVSFGDSLSDVGTYTPATQLPGTNPPQFFGGRFTTNSATSTVWVENLAATLGIPVTAAEVGFNNASVKCPAAATPALATSCTAYGQGGARVTDPNGIGRSVDPQTGQPAGALTVPVVTQIANHVARFGGFDEDDLILVWAGNNDVFVQFDAFAERAAEAQAAAAAGQITPEQANLAVSAARADAQAAIRQAALELAGYVRDEILARGGRYVAVMLLSDIADTPFGLSLPASARTVLTDLSGTFNQALREGLARAPVRLVDTFALGKETFGNPQRFGIANNTQPACDPARISAITGGQVASGSSLFCNSTPGAPFNGLAAGADPLTWQFADDVHPTTGGHRVISDAIEGQLRAFGWI
ncbi:MAG TPA: SGNH/GDSL hydrolase family protein [Albitalea sp.]